MPHSISKMTLLPLIATTALLTYGAHAEPTGYNQINFTVEVNQEVDNDEVTATLYKKAQASTPKQLAVELNTVINKAVNIAKSYSTIDTTTGSQHTHPIYNKQGKITGWTGTASIKLKSHDFSKTSDLIATLQNELVVQNIEFGVSEQKQKELNKELTKQASLKFKEQATSLANTWGMSGFKLINVSISSNNNYYPRYEPVMLMQSESSKAGAPAQSFEAGNSSLAVRATGTIELIPFMK